MPKLCAIPKLVSAPLYPVKCSAGCGTLSVVLSGSATGTSLTSIGLPIGASLAAVAGRFGITSVAIGVFVKSMAPKLEKHQNTVSVCYSKINTIMDIVSKAFNDNKMLDEEFKLVSEEVRKYSDMTQWNTK